VQCVESWPKSDWIMKERLQEYALIAEIVGGIAIVASLLFVGLQISQNNKLIEASAMNASNERTDNTSRMGIEYGVSEILLKIRNDEALSLSERARLAVFVETLLRHFETTYFQYSLGLINEEIWQSESRGLGSLVNGLAFQTVFPDWKNNDRTIQFGDSFVQLVNALLIE
jgi:hypothetical protein